MPRRHDRLALTLAFALAAGPASAALVNSTADTDDGSCDATAGGCTLREAIDDANASGEPITFDPAVFPPVAGAVITVGSALPALTRSGTRVEGAGASVVVDGSGLAGGEDGLVVESGGAALSQVTLRGITVRGFPGDGVVVCAGARPGCDAELSRTTLEGVVSRDHGGRGIVVSGAAQGATRIAACDASGNGATGMDVTADGAFVGAEVVGCTVRSNAAIGLNLSAGGDFARAVVVGNVVVESGTIGMNVNAAGVLSKPRVVGNQALRNGTIGLNVNSAGDLIAARIEGNGAAANGTIGIFVNSAAEMSRPRIQDNASLANGSIGMLVNASQGVTRGRLVGNAAADNQSHGIQLNGERCKLTANRASANQGDGFSVLPPATGNRLARNDAVANAGVGIRVGAGGNGNKLTGNRAVGSDVQDLVDENAGCGTDGWKKNLFATSNESCIE